MILWGVGLSTHTALLASCIVLPFVSSSWQGQHVHAVAKVPGKVGGQQ